MAAEKLFLKSSGSEAYDSNRPREVRPLTHYHVRHAGRLKAVFCEKVPQATQTSFVLPPSLKVISSAEKWNPGELPGHMQPLAQAIVQWAYASGPRVLWLYGGSGSGKTFLLEKCLASLASDLRTTSCDRFFSDWVSGFKTNRPTPISEYKTRTRMLVLEGLESLCTKGKTQIELLRTIEAIHARGGAVVMTSVGSPLSLGDQLAPQLISKLSSGLIFEMPRVGTEDLDETIRTELTTLPAEEREQIGRLLRPVRWASYASQRAFFLNLKVRLDSGARFQQINVEELLRLTNGGSTMAPSKITPEAILEKTCALFGVSVAEVKGTRRTRHVGDARLFCYRALHELAGLTQSEIAELLGRDPSSVNKGIQQVRHRTEISPLLQRRWQWVKDFVLQGRTEES